MSIQKIADAGFAWNGSNIRNADTSNTQANSSATKSDAAAQVLKSDKAQNPSEQDVQQAASAMQDFIQPLNNTLKFGVDKDSGQVVVKVIDSANGSVIKQIPSKEAIDLAKALDKLKGLLVQQKA